MQLKPMRFHEFGECFLMFHDATENLELLKLATLKR